jgi:hypothetical protein
MRFLIFVIDTAESSGTTEELRAINEFNDALVANNQLLQAVGIASPDKAFQVDNRQNQGVIAAESLNGAEFYSGFWLIEASDSTVAKQLAMDASLACNRRVELRPLL